MVMPVSAGFTGLCQTIQKTAGGLKTILTKDGKTITKWSVVFQRGTFYELKIKQNVSNHYWCYRFSFRFLGGEFRRTDCSGEYPKLCRSWRTVCRSSACL